MNEAVENVKGRTTTEFLRKVRDWLKEDNLPDTTVPDRFFQEVVCVNATNVASWVRATYDGKTFDLSMIPNAALPWPACWFEWEDHELKEKVYRLGAICWGVSVGETEARMDLIRDVRTWPTKKVWTHIKNLFKAANRDYHWYNNYLVFVWTVGGSIIPVFLARLLLNEKGVIASDLGAIGTTSYAVPPGHTKEETTNVWFETVTIPLFASAFCHCKNVTLVDVKPTAGINKVNKKRAKKNKKLLPYYRYYVLSITSIKKAFKSASEATGGDIKKAFHICRGHFKDYRSGPGLFGKYRDMYWWDMHTRGDKAVGKIEKMYDVKTGSKKGE